MGNIVHVVVIISIIFLLVLNGSDGKRRKPKPVGKCLNRRGNLKCNSKQICMTKKELCVPYDMSPKCRCKKNKVRGCEDSVGRSVCKYDEKCLQKKSEKPCSNPRSRKCKCTKRTKILVPGDIGCYVRSGELVIFLPFDLKYHPIKTQPCRECMCIPKDETYGDYCRQIPNCNAAVQLIQEG